jgi:predicted MPP superfamily phosphohydrolase
MIARLILFTLFVVGVDLYAYQAYLSLFGSHQILAAVYFGITAISLLNLLVFFNFPLRERLGWSRQLTASVAFMGFSTKLFTAIILLPYELVRLIALAIGSFENGLSETLTNGIPYHPVWSGIAVAAGLLITFTFIYGALFNVYNYRINHIGLSFRTLPESFSGLRVVQISDIHSGSLSDKEGVERGVNAINALDPDLIFFTGDLVNNIAEEAEYLKEIFGKLRSKHGVYSILGNHDYGDYYYWPSQEQKLQNLQQLKDIHRQMGWRLLLNEHEVIDVAGHSIAIAGVENWSASDRFPKYGRLNDALNGLSEDIPVLLLSHDPSHWKAQVTDHERHIDATFSGHTHGMQFGFEWGRFRWSPVQYVYKQWAGLYEEAGKYLYVNRGFGVIGYPGRVGILPEITHFTIRGMA